MSAKPIQDEAALFKRLGEGSEEALKAILAQYFFRLMEYSFGIVADEGLAEEIVLDILQTLWENRQKTAEMTNPVGWLFKCVRHRSINELKAKGARLIIRIENTTDLSDNINIEQDLDSKQRLSELRLAIEKLPPQQRAIIQLKSEGLSRREIAEQRHLSESTIKKQINSAFKTLRAILKRF